MPCRRPVLIARRGSSKRTNAVIGTFAVGGIQRLAGLPGDGSTRRRERSTDTRSAVGVAQPANLQVRERYEFRQMISAVVESLRLDAQIERPKGQAQLTRAKVDFLSVFGRKSQSDATIVKVNREPQARIVGAGRISRVRGNRKAYA